MQVNKDREYIYHLESIGEGKINWDRWETICEETRKLLSNMNNKK